VVERVLQDKATSPKGVRSNDKNKWPGDKDPGVEPLTLWGNWQ
jgi:hypothetical protein